ncbi:6784_t:CDS:2 [Paraglomus occultum]|uniref:6784_t:CDS:1 n=1 Tax=Paraglomus occultum TaxID=144539 RepID=A0A9N9AVP5_9GLOM|nr:6784_t:CDS:2 [Paraglomus occultum]
MLPVTTSLENPMNVSEDLPRELDPIGNHHDNDMNADRTPFSNATRGRKSKFISEKLDLTGREPIMVVNNLQNTTTGYREEVTVVNKSVHEPVMYYSIGRKQFARMTTKQLQDCAKLFEAKVRNNTGL